MYTRTNDILGSMISERTIQFCSKYSKKRIQSILEDFLAITFSIAWDTDRWVIYVQGKPTDSVLRKENFIEISPPNRPGDPCIVTTQHADPITESIADGLAKYLGYRLDGKRVYFCLHPTAKR